MIRAHDIAATVLSDTILAAFEALFHVDEDPSPAIVAALLMCRDAQRAGDRELYEESLRLCDRLIPDQPDGERGLYYRMGRGSYVGKGRFPGCRCRSGPYKVNVLSIGGAQDWGLPSDG